MTAESAARNAGQPIQPYLVICRDCGEAIAVRMSTGRLRALGEWDQGENGAVVIVCPACQRANRIRRSRLVAS